MSSPKSQKGRSGNSTSEKPSYSNVVGSIGVSPWCEREIALVVENRDIRVGVVLM